VQKTGLFAVFSLIVLMIIPAYADVDKAEIDKETFTIDDKFTISGTVSDANRVFLSASLKGPNGEKLFRNAQADPGTFSFIPIDAKLIFKSKGEYTIQVFTHVQDIATATIIKLFSDNIGSFHVMRIEVIDAGVASRSSGANGVSVEDAATNSNA